MDKRKSVTVSITSKEFDAMYLAFNEYSIRLESSDSEDYNEYATRQKDSFDAFQEKYWRAVRAQAHRDANKKLIKKLRKIGVKV